MAKVHRQAKGQSLVEGAAIIPVLAVFAIALVFLFLNAATIGTYNYRLNAVASEAARQMNAGRWWLGMQRTGFDVAAAKNDVKTLILEEIKTMGWEGATVNPDEIEITTEQKTAGNRPLNIVRVNFDVKGLKVHSAGLFPNTVTLHAYGICSDAEYHVPRHGMAVIHVIDKNTGASQRVIRVPIYNATVGNNTAADPQRKYLTAGPSIGTYPMVTMNIYAKTSGSRLSLFKTSEPGKTNVQDLGPWGPEEGQTKMNTGVM